MLFGYPIDATENNWLHDCLCEAIRTIHAVIDKGGKYPTWPAVLPEAHRETLRKRKGLRTRLEDYYSAVQGLQKAQRDVLLNALDSQNCIAELVSGVRDCITLDDLPEDIRKSVRAPFDFAFDLLTELGIRDHQYETIYSATDEHLCPFCGTEFFDAPGMRREALDHYLARSRYIFATANLRNLVPMGQKCNSSYKLATDLLHRADGSRRMAFNPYNHRAISVSLDESEPFGGVNGGTPRWAIRFEPDTPEVSTWDEVFSVRLRYERNHLDVSFRSWLTHFKNFTASDMQANTTDAELVNALRRYVGFLTEMGLQDRAFLKAAVFRMLLRHCELGYRRLLDFLLDLIRPPQTPI